MRVEVASKDELQSIAGKFKGLSSQFSSEAVGVIGSLLKTENFDGINISQAATTIQNNLRSISRDVETLALRFNNYVDEIKKLDTYDLNISDDIGSSNSSVDSNSSTFDFKGSSGVNEKVEFDEKTEFDKKSEFDEKEVLFLFEEKDFVSDN